MPSDKEFDEQIIRKHWFGYDNSKTADILFKAQKKKSAPTIGLLLKMFAEVRKDEKQKVLYEEQQRQREYDDYALAIELASPIFKPKKETKNDAK